MKSVSILICFTTVVTISNSQNDIFSSKSISLSKYRSPEERRKFSLFPKINKKYVVTESSIEKSQFSILDMTKRPIMPKMSLNEVHHIKDSSTYYKVPEPRRPLMKSKKFIIEFTTASLNSESTIDKTSQRNLFSPNEATVKYTEMVLSESVNNLVFKDFSDVKTDRFADTNEDVATEISDKEIDEDNFATESEFDDLLITHRNVLKSDKNASKDKTNIDQYSLKPIIANKLVEELKKLDDLDTREKTTDSYGTRMKRSNNFIEEENLATTFAGFKFTSPVESRLNYDLTYKNINS